VVRRRFQQVDVFSHEPLRGNPVAVVLDAEGLTTEQMQRLARWTNLSETTFVLPPTTPDADYRVRIFTLAHELPFAGHPTLGTCHAWLQAGGRPAREDLVVQECGAGLVPLRRGADLAFAAPELVRSGPVDEALLGQIAEVLGLGREEIVDAAWVDNGPGWVGVLLRDAAAVLAVEADVSRFAGEGSLDVGLVGFQPDGAETAIEVRALFSDEHGALREDPVTGSLNASIAQWLLGSGRLTAPYVASQGTRLDRRGRPRIDQDDQGTIWVGGPTITVVDGHLGLADGMS
jgi:PhzF family phenazine biosynthesis protein